MQFASVRLVTRQIDTMVAFYAALTRSEVSRPAPAFAEFKVGGLTLAISDEAMVEKFNAGAAIAAANRSAIIEFMVEDVDAVRQRLPAGTEIAMEAATMPWGNRSLLLRDPDGTVINIFSRPAS